MVFRGPQRWLAAIGLLPVREPVEEALLLLVPLLLYVFYRERLRETWYRADSVPWIMRARARAPRRPYPERHVFQGFGGDRFRTAIARACTASGVPAFSPHDFA